MELTKLSGYSDLKSIPHFSSPYSLVNPDTAYLDNIKDFKKKKSKLSSTEIMFLILVNEVVTKIKNIINKKEEYKSIFYLQDNLITFIDYDYLCYILGISGRQLNNILPVLTLVGVKAVKHWHRDISSKKAYLKIILENDSNISEPTVNNKKPANLYIPRYLFDLKSADGKLLDNNSRLIYLCLFNNLIFRGEKTGGYCLSSYAYISNFMYGGLSDTTISKSLSLLKEVGYVARLDYADMTKNLKHKISNKTKNIGMYNVCGYMDKAPCFNVDNIYISFNTQRKLISLINSELASLIDLTSYKKDDEVCKMEIIKDTKIAFKENEVYSDLFSRKKEDFEEIIGDKYNICLTSISSNIFSKLNISGLLQGCVSDSKKLDSCEIDYLLSVARAKGLASFKLYLSRIIYSSLVKASDKISFRACNDIATVFINRYLMILLSNFRRYLSGCKDMDVIMRYRLSLSSLKLTKKALVDMAFYFFKGDSYMPNVSLYGTSFIKDKAKFFRYILSDILSGIEYNLCRDNYY